MNPWVVVALAGASLIHPGCEFDPHGTRYLISPDAGPGADVEVQRDTGPQPDVAITCGNETVDQGEECDGSDLNLQTCTTQGYEGGDLSCQGCLFDFTSCHRCGDSAKQLEEECDDLDFGGATCQSLGLGTGELICTQSCVIDTSGCSTGHCGDGTCDPGEEGGVCQQDCTTVLFADGFDGGASSGWSTWDDNGSDGDDYWGVSTDHVHAGSHAFWCSGVGNEDYWYDNNMDAWATHAVDLTAAVQHVVIELWVWINTYDSSDYFRLMLSSDSGSNWTEVERRTGQNLGWNQIVVNRDSEAGNASFMLGLHFHSNGDWRREGGAFVDEVRVFTWH